MKEDTATQPDAEAEAKAHVEAETAAHVEAEIVLSASIEGGLILPQKFMNFCDIVADLAEDGDKRATKLLRVLIGTSRKSVRGVRTTTGVLPCTLAQADHLADKAGFNVLSSRSLDGARYRQS